MRFSEPGAGSADFDLTAPATIVCARCLRGNLDLDCLTRTCKPAHQESAAPMSGAPPK